MQYIKMGREAGPSFIFSVNAGYKVIAMAAVRSYYSSYFAKKTNMGSIVKVFWRCY
jgi:hypothetical protein